MALLEEADVLCVHAIGGGGMIIRHRHAFEGRDAGRRKDLQLRAVHRDQPGIRLRQAQLGGQIFLGARAGHRNVQTDQISLGLPAGNVLGEPGSEIDQTASPQGN